MKQLIINDQNIKDLTAVCDAALKASGLAALETVNKVSQWVSSAKEVVQKEEPSEKEAA